MPGLLRFRSNDHTTVQFVHLVKALAKLLERSWHSAD
jgi:hypothetical protein